MGTFAVEGIKSVSINGASLTYMERGTGEPVVFVHGGYSDLRTWLAQIPAFAQEYRALVRSLVLCEPPVLPLFVSNVPKPQEIIRLLLRRPRTAIDLLNFGIKVIKPTEKAYKQGDYEGGTRAFVRGILGADAYDVLPELRKEQMRENESTNVAQMLGAGFPC